MLAATPIGSGHIHHTYKLVTGRGTYIAQQFNTHVFQHPERIHHNLRTAQTHLRNTAPAYSLLVPLANRQGEWLTYEDAAQGWRLFPFLDGSRTIDVADTAHQAFAAAQAFGRLTKYLREADVTHFQETIPRFHDLAFRYGQFQHTFHQASHERMAQAHTVVEALRSFSFLVTDYEQAVAKGLPLRITHNDTKINNVLFDESLTRVLAPIDLDTLMPGYFFYDLGDMLRTYVSPVGEEENDVTLISVRQPFYQAVLHGYLSEMDDVLTPLERSLLPKAGLFMTYIMALRFATDFLQGDTYFHTHYADQNLVRAANQITLLRLLQRQVSW